MYYLYLIECSDETYYVGVTNDLSRRMREHKHGAHEGSYTYNRRPVKLKYYLMFDDIREAISYEKKIKKWSKAKKDAFFLKQWDKLRELAKCRNKTSSDNYKLG